MPHLRMWNILFVLLNILIAAQADFYCGQPLKDRRIIGGDPSQPFQFPWQVVLYRGDSSSLYCGGSLISSKTVLTAAHCTSYYNTKWVGIPDGSIYYEDIPRIAVKSFTNHPYYDQGADTNYDLAIITLFEEVSWGPGILPICLPHPNGNYDDVLATVTGWGETFAGDTGELMRVNVTTMPNHECKEYYSPDDITGSMICAWAPGKDSCWGDSGGPMTTLVQEEAFYVQIGIVSWGYGCAEPEYPGVYARVANSLYWILMQMEGTTLPSPVQRE